MVLKLVELSSAAYVIDICTHPDVKKQIFSCYLQPLESIDEYKSWSHALKEVVAKKLIDFPSVLMHIIPKFLINFVGLQMLKWSKFSVSNFDFNLKSCEEFLKYSFFTSRGKIDEKAAARELVNDPSLSIFLQYKIACYYYLTDIIPVLWQNVVDNESNYEQMLSKLRSWEPVVLWSEFLSENQGYSNVTISEKSSFYNFLKKTYCLGIERGYPLALEYAWKTLMSNDLDNPKREIQIIRHFNYVDIFLPSIFINIEAVSSEKSLLSSDLEMCGDILKFAIHQLDKEKLKIYVHCFHFMKAYCLLRLLLYWPYQHLFLDIADILFENLSNDDFYVLLQNIVDYIEDEDVDQSYNYRQLLREFWIRSPSHFKKFVRDVELESYVKDLYEYNFIKGFLSKKLAKLNHFTANDEDNFQLIFYENATAEFKSTFFDRKGKEICQKLILVKKFRLANLSLECVSDEKEMKTMKISFAINSLPNVFKNEDIDLIEEIVKWVATNAEEIEDVKTEIFPQAFTFSKIINHYFRKQISINFLNKILKWFLHKDHNIKEWKSNLVIDKDFRTTFVSLEFDPNMFNKFLKWVGYSKKKRSNIKREILLFSLPSIMNIYARDFRPGKTNGTILSKVYPKSIFYLCLYDKRKVNEFINMFHNCCLNSHKQKMCAKCWDSERGYFNSKNESDYDCIRSDFHSINGPYRTFEDCEDTIFVRIRYLEDADLICRFLSRKLDALLKKKKNKVQNFVMEKILRIKRK